MFEGVLPGAAILVNYTTYDLDYLYIHLFTHLQMLHIEWLSFLQLSFFEYGR